MKIALINVRYSPNLGDGLLSECLEAELGRHLPDASFVTIDLAGRKGYGASSRWRGPLLGLLLRTPPWFRRIVARKALAHLMKRLEPEFARAFADCQAAVVGGGNLLADADLNFPSKIAGVVEAARKARPQGLPTAVFAVGVSRNWSEEGSGLFHQLLAAPSLVSLSVRDEFSRDALLCQAPAVAARPIGVVRDPGLLAARHFTPQVPQRRQPIGLCITDPVALRYHGGEGTASELTAWFGDLAAGLAARGHMVLLFTNGSPEDRAFLARNAAAWRARDPERIRMAKPAQAPSGLVHTIANCSLVIAHRMHACIVAHAFSIPTVGLRWDPKLDAFFATAGRSAFLHDAARSPVADVVASAEAALAEGVDSSAHAALIADAVDDVASLADTLRKAVAA